MNSDDFRGGRDQVWKNVGPGVPFNHLCIRCGKLGPNEGKRKWRGELRQCAKCAAADEAKKAAKLLDKNRRL
jgi:hypothetical protein